MTNIAATSQTGPGRADLTPIVTEVLDTLATLQGLLQRLTELASRKLDAMRRADTGDLQSCTAMEHRLLADVSAARKEREAIVARLAQTLHWPEAVTAPLGEVADRLPEPFSSYIRAKNRALREVADTLQQKNRLAAVVARNLHTHVRSIFAELAKANQECVLYGPSGQHEQTSTDAWVDAVG
jgi:flagellar biosynthesis/type III secretory pathway chaperone